MIYSLKDGAPGATSHGHKTGRSLKSKKTLALAGVLLLAAVSVVALVYSLVGNEESKVTPPPPAPVVSSPVVQEPEQKPEQDRFNQQNIQSTVDAWNATHDSVGVVVANEAGQTLAAANPHKTFFAASIYKLYVAYIGYQKVDDGTYGWDDAYANGWSREKCLDEMIRSSNSPCAERMMAELGKSAIQERLQQYGLTDTSMQDLTTSAADAAIILANIYNGKDLSDSSREKYLASMLGQQYRSALPKGFAGLDVYNKVGFRELVEYHDVGIVILSDGTPLVVSVLTQNTGTRNIAQLAAGLIEATAAD